MNRCFRIDLCTWAWCKREKECLLYALDNRDKCPQPIGKRTKKRGSRAIHKSKQPHKVRITKKWKLDIIRRDKFCVFCGTQENLTVDHKIPKSKGGTNEPENLQAACYRCNSIKGNKIYE